MTRLQDDLARWLWNSATGAFILGRARMGKTTAVRTLARELRTRTGTPLPFLYVSIPPRDQRTVASIYRHLCWSVGNRPSIRTTADHLSDWFVHHVADLAATAGCPQVVLFVDEMQRLTPTQFGAFADLHDRLQHLQVLLSVIFIGNDQECGPLCDAIKQPAYAHVYGRFFTHRAAFRGLNCKDDVEACLAQYDTLRYPDDGPTYTESFLPEAFRNGWRLALIGQDLWRVFQQYQRTHRIETWGMQYFTVCTNVLLTVWLAKEGVESFCDEMVHDGIRVSGLVPDLVTDVTEVVE